MVTKKNNRGGFAAVADPAFAEGSTARLVTGHSLQWLKAQPSKSVSIFFFSPPYNKRRPGGDKCSGALWNAQLGDGYASFGDDMAHGDYVAWMHEVITECWRVLKDDGAIFFQHKDQPFKGKLLTPEELIPADVLDYLRQRIIWHRQAAYTPNKNFLNPSFEFIHLLAKPKFKFATSGKLFDVLSIRPVAKIDPNHPAPMPVELPQRIFEQLKPEHDVICDVFSGSGTTGVAARATGRHYIGVELDAGYNAKAAERLNCTVETLAAPEPRKRLSVKATLFNDDCLKSMAKLPDESVHLIAIDLPYGVSHHEWDKIVPMAKMFAEFRRILTPTGNIVMTAQGRFSAALIAAADDMYCYSMVWAKTRKTQHLHKDYRALAEHEDVLVFAKGGMGNNAKVHPIYNPQGLIELDKPVTSRNGNQKDSFYSVTGKAAERGRNQTHTNYPTSILYFPSVGPKEKVKGKGNAPQTQKPVALMDYLIRTYSNAGDTVLDCTMGSGTTGVAALQAERNFIGMEINPRFFENTVARLEASAPDAMFVTSGPEPVLDIVDEIIAAKRAAYWASQREQDPAIRYATLCSGVEAVSLAWEGLGYQAEFFSEIGKFQSEFLAERYPTVPNVGDMTLIDGRAYAGKLDVLWASTPCQTFSRDGDGAALDDPRGALTLTAVKLADEINPPVFILENVPDFLNIENGEAFGQVLAALVGEDQPLVPAGRRWTNAGVVRGPRRNIAWRVLDAQYSGLAQRRERVFVVACPVGGADPAAILLEQGKPRQDCRELQKLQAAEAEAYAAGRSVMWFNGDKTPKFNEHVAYTLKANAAYGNLSGVLIDGEAYRLSPEDREALMGMPRGYTDVANASDSSRNEAIGNSLAVPDVRWLGERVKTALAKPVHSDNVVTLTRSCRAKPPRPDIIIDDLCDYLIAA